MISTAQAQQYIEQALGIVLPSFLVAAAVEDVEACEPAMIGAGYSEPLQIRVQSMAVALVAATGSPRRLANQHAPSGAARGFKYADKDMSHLRRSLFAMDTAGTTLALVGPDPASPTLLMVV